MIPNGARMYAYYHNHPIDMRGGYGNTSNFSGWDTQLSITHDYIRGFVSSADDFRNKKIMGYQGIDGKDLKTFWIPESCF